MLFLWVYLTVDLSGSSSVLIAKHTKRNIFKWLNYLFFLEDDLLLQNFDCVELVVGFQLCKQDLHDGWLISGLFSKHFAPASQHNGVRTFHQKCARNTDS